MWSSSVVHQARTEAGKDHKLNRHDSNRLEFFCCGDTIDDLLEGCLACTLIKGREGEVGIKGIFMRQVGIVEYNGCEEREAAGLDNWQKSANVYYDEDVDITASNYSQFDSQSRES